MVSEQWRRVDLATDLAQPLYDQFFLFGDSITQDSYAQDRGFGFSAALQSAYIRRLDVVNRGLRYDNLFRHCSTLIQPTADTTLVTRCRCCQASSRLPVWPGSASWYVNPSPADVD